MCFVLSYVCSMYCVVCAMCDVFVVLCIVFLGLECMVRMESLFSFLNVYATLNDRAHSLLRLYILY